MRPLLIRQVARVSQMITLVFRPVLVRPHRRPPRIRPPSINHNRFMRLANFWGRHLWMRMKLYQTLQIATMCAWFSNFLLNAFVSLVNLRLCIRIVRLERSL